MKKKITIVSIHSCPNEKIGLGNSGGLNVYVKNLHSYLLRNKYESYLITRDHGNCDFDKHSNKIIILTTNASGAESSGYIYDINNGAITQHDNLFNWYALSNPSDVIIGNTESEL